MDFLFIVPLVMVICATILGLAFLVLLSLPKSRLRVFLLRMAGYAAPVLAAVYVVSPIDLIPDVIPIIGWIDDAAAIAAGVTGFLVARSAGKEQPSQSAN